MDKRNFLIGFGVIFAVIFFLVGLAVFNRVEQRTLAAIPLNQTATAERLAFIEALKFGLSATPTITPTGTPRPIFSTFTPRPTIVITNGITGTQTNSLTPILIPPTQSGTPPLTPSRTPGPSPTDTPKPTFTPTGAVTQAPVSLSGRVLLNEVAVSGVVLALEDLGIQVIANTATTGDGSYIFTNLAPTATPYNVVFSQEDNPRYDEDEVLSFAWLGPIQLPATGGLLLPGLEIAPLGFGQVSPAAEAEVSAAAITGFTPLTFTWTAYPGADEYWVDLLAGDDPDPVWQSDFVSGTTVSFDGTLDDNNPITAGEYWWGIGAVKDVGDYTLTVYGLLVALTVTQ